jgi:hypothetical protein
MKNMDSSKGNSFSNEVKINLNVFGTLMLNGVGRHVHGANVVIIDQGGLVQRCVQLSQQLAQPGGLSDGIGNNTILSFSTGARYNVLALGRPGDLVTKEHSVT